MVRFICVPSQVWLPVEGGAFTNASISAFCGVPGPIAKFENVSVYDVPGATGTAGGGVGDGTTSATVEAGLAARFVTCTLCEALVSSTSSSFTVPGSGSEKGNIFDTPMEIGLRVVTAYTVTD